MRDEVLDASHDVQDIDVALLQETDLGCMAKIIRVSD